MKRKGRLCSSPDKDGDNEKEEVDEADDGKSECDDLGGDERFETPNNPPIVAVLCRYAYNGMLSALQSVLTPLRDFGKRDLLGRQASLTQSFACNT